MENTKEEITDSIVSKNISLFFFILHALYFSCALTYLGFSASSIFAFVGRAVVFGEIFAVVEPEQS